MRRGRRDSALATVLFALIGLVVGTAVGRSLALGVLSLPIGFAPVDVNFYVGSLRLGVATNVAGLAGAAVGLLLMRVL